MALAEARAAWQRTANRCFVQEDAKRAPKLACCSSATQSSKQVDDAGPVTKSDGHDTASLGFLPPKRNPSYSNLSPNSRWGLQCKPYCGYERRLTSEHINKQETGRGNSEAGCNVTTCLGEDRGVGKQGLKTMNITDVQSSAEHKDICESYEMLEMDTVDSSVSKQHEVCVDLESSWIGSDKTDPWWRLADRDELALFIAERSSLDIIENCDLPQPQSTHAKSDSYGHLCCYNPSVIYESRIGKTPQFGSYHNSVAHRRDNLISKTAYVDQFEGHSQDGEHKSVSDNIDKTTSEAQSEEDPSKAQVLEALRHSQTRAREAEKAAKQANAEKEHIVKLLFREASNLFAYKQWFQLMQLDNLYFQINNNNSQPIPSLFPMTLPWVPCRPTKPRKSWRKVAKKRYAKRSRPSCDVGRYAVIFALGLGLVGAGLLLGWTVGWILPIF